MSDRALLSLGEALHALCGLPHTIQDLPGSEIGGVYPAALTAGKKPGRNHEGICRGIIVSGCERGPLLLTMEDAFVFPLPWISSEGWRNPNQHQVPSEGTIRSAPS